MSFDFFNQKSQPTLSFSASENAFLTRLLPFLDPQNSRTVSARAAIELLNRSGLPNGTIKEIWQVVNPNCNWQTNVDRDSLQYEDVQSLIRLVAYGQTGVPISRENLELNISCNAPAFEFEAQSSAESHPQGQGKHGLSEQEIVAFDRTWAGLQGKATSDFIGGTAIKKLYQTEANKESLSKAWKMCSNALKGYLTKGELFIFLHLIGQAKQRQPLPAELTPQMKNIIARMDAKIKNYPQQSKSATKQSAPPPAALDEPARMLHEAERKNTEGLSAVADNEAKFANLVDWLSRYIEQSQQNNANVQTEMQKIKTNQLQTFERLNGSIIKLQRVIQRQGAIIEDLTRQLQNRNAADQQRIRMVEGISEKNVPQPPAGGASPPPPFESAQEISRNDSVRIERCQLALNMYNQWRPMSPEELPGIQKRIWGMSEEELQGFIKQVADKIEEQKQEALEEQRQRAHANGRASGQYDHSTSNIIGNIEINPGGLGSGLDSSKVVDNSNFEFAANILMNLEIPEPPAAENPFF